MMSLIKIWKILRHNTLTLLGAGLVILIVLMGLLSPLISPYDPNLMNIPARLQAPGWSHPLEQMKWEEIF